jgi:hypothetical protein
VRARQSQAARDGIPTLQDASIAQLLRQLAEKEHAIAAQRGEADKVSALAGGKLAAMVRRFPASVHCHLWASPT